MKQLAFILLFFTSMFVLGQEEKKYDKIISMRDLQHMLRTQKVVELINTYVKRHYKLTENRDRNQLPYIGEDAIFWELVYAENGDVMGHRPLGMSGIHGANAFFRNCKFDQFWLDSCQFESLTFVFCDIGQLKIDDSEFNEFQLDGASFSDGWLSINNCKFNRPVGLFSLNLGSASFMNTLEGDITRNSFVGFDLNGDFKNLEVKKNTFKHYTSFDHVKVHDQMTIQKNSFIIDSTVNPSQDNKWWLSLSDRKFTYKSNYNPSLVIIEECDINQLDISENVFKYIDERLISQVYNFDFEGTDVHEFSMKNESLERLSFNNTGIDKQFSMDSVVINKDFSAKGIVLPDYNIDITWKQLKGKLNFRLTDTTNYQALTPKELANEKLYNSYIRSYKKFFSVFKNSGDLKSANACYAEMKDVETRRLKYLSDTEGGVDNLLNYQLNVFLKYFAEYGTSPIKSIKISGWVILIFSFFYFFFYSAWDQINRKFLMERGDKLMSYFKSEQKLEDLYSDKHKDDLFTFTQFKQNLKESRTEVPFFFMVFLKPLYWVSVIKHKFNSFLYRRVEFLQGRWSDLTSGKKWLIGTLTFLTILTYGLYLIFVRSLNSLILSINTFTTLGFGDIPVVGISRYVAILEGFLGWFLLSIFSVSLISQILQN